MPEHESVTTIKPFASEEEARDRVRSLTYSSFYIKERVLIAIDASVFDIIASYSGDQIG